MSNLIIFQESNTFDTYVQFLQSFVMTTYTSNGGSDKVLNFNNRHKYEAELVKAKLFSSQCTETFALYKRKFITGLLPTISQRENAPRRQNKERTKISNGSFY